MRYGQAGIQIHIIKKLYIENNVLQSKKIVLALKMSCLNHKK